MKGPPYRLPTLDKYTYSDGSTETLADAWDELCNHGFLAVPNAMLRSPMGLSVYAHRVLITLMSWTIKSDPGRPVRRRGKPIRLSHLMEWTGFSRNTIKRCLIDLEEAGFIAVDRMEGEINEYLIIHENIIDALYSDEPWDPARRRMFTDYDQTMMRRRMDEGQEGVTA